MTFLLIISILHQQLFLQSAQTHQWLLADQQPFVSSLARKWKRYKRMIFSVVFKIVVFQSAKLNSHFVGKIFSQKLGWIIEKEVLIKSYVPSLHLLHFLFCCKIDILLKKKCDMQSYVFHQIWCFPSTKANIWKEKSDWKLNFCFLFRLMFSERSLVRIDSHEWTLNLPQNMIFDQLRNNFSSKMMQHMRKVALVEGLLLVAFRAACEKSDISVRRSAKKDWLALSHQQKSWNQQNLD